ncbi:MULTISPECIES: Gfo/Idh/MocA family protein [Brevibacillus]|uniref:Dehydrogenase n=1 Tax=Brevibacillus parabrevis TaxID=54914 RepID=A0A4Y3PQD0_BREPA|nr:MULTISPECIES: Gfo/Idh/MocA family oxidoreductase [Brevibacillus]MBU8713109.1 Gfo/Idh/MocA family oxidoreductase [Brevibacillus parabrevis]MDH6348636.1 UDP-N-acetylglucosamine 3-dehydrogenase [Brevibacillus sp. 1238]MDR5002221.1 Gfo/Idh/MocA family oxidoreductase [Brevibacillus parabrevis]RNB96955.1 gfo/Idh/MocA family oxidoreductase [Brevibacillus parabrevis]UED70774.1 Gfo/Idh/MocA family oxidoreductase [Brevibacillus sp. HD3.3A]
MKLGIISVAHMHAYSYANAIGKLAGVQLVGVADEDEARGKEAAEKWGVPFYHDYRELLAADVDAVIITSENAKHHEHTVAAAKAGKHILCEKPLATTLAAAQEMIEICREQGVILQTAFPVRFHPAVVRAKQLVEQGKVGRIMAIRGTNRGQNPGGWFVDPAKSGGGAVIDHTVHVVDLMRWFMGVEVREVYAEVDSKFSPTPIDDCGILTMEFENGVFATLDCSWSRNKTFPVWGDVTMEIIGTEGTISLDAFSQKLDVYSNDKGLKWVNWGDDMDSQLVSDFVASVREKKAPSVTGEDGMRAVEVALAAYQSAESKQPVVIR